jgi:hypothetical protein
LTRAVASGWHPPVLSTGAESPEQLIQYKRRRKSSIVMEYDKYGPGRLERVFSDDDDDEEKGDSTAMEVVPEDAKEE